MLLFVRAVRLLLVTVILLVASRSVVAEPLTKLPDPLTLKYALNIAAESHPDLAKAQADIDLSRAGQQAAESATGIESSLEARVRFIEPNSISQDQTHDDHKLSLYLQKELYDFGRSKANIAAADAEARSQRQYYQQVLNQRRLEIMQAYFNVLLADLEFYRDNEDMSVAYVLLDKMRDRRELKQLADINVLEQQIKYQRIRRKRYASEARQRITRGRLALALNRPNHPPENLDIPELPILKRKLVDVNEIQKIVAENNPRLKALTERLAAARMRVQAARAGDNPSLRGEVEASTYSRDTGARDDFRVGVVLDIPLSRGGRTQASIAREQAKLNHLEAEYNKLKMDIQHAVLENWFEIKILRAQQDEAKSQYDFRELDLERARAEYELEFKTDLGRSMVRITDAQLFIAETDYKVALAWARLDALMNRPVTITLAEIPETPADKGKAQ